MGLVVTRPRQRFACTGLKYDHEYNRAAKYKRNSGAYMLHVNDTQEEPWHMHHVDYIDYYYATKSAQIANANPTRIVVNPTPEGAMAIPYAIYAAYTLCSIYRFVGICYPSRCCRHAQADRE